MGFEQPSPEIGLKFSFKGDVMGNLPPTIPFPSSGDLRWRPILGRFLGEDDVYIPLAELYDRAGRWHGDGIAYIEHVSSEPKGGRELYVWFRFLDMPLSDVILYDLFLFLSDRI